MNHGLTLAISACLLSACSSTLDMNPTEYAHILSVNSSGRTLPIRVDGVEKSNDLKVQMRAVGQGLQEYEGNHVIIVIHGGLVSTKEALHEARKAMAAGIDEDAYPIFMNWETGMARSYVDHLFLIRRGREQPWLACLSSPFFLVADMGRALARLPITLTRQGLQNFGERLGQLEPERVPEGWTESAKLNDNIEPDTAWELLKSDTSAVIPGALRLVTTPIIDGVGVSAFGNMERKARVLFLWDEDFERGSPGMSGALSHLGQVLRQASDISSDPIQSTFRGLAESLEALRRSHPEHDHATETDCGLCVEIVDLREEVLTAAPLRITLIAHSMGAIAANEFIRRNPDLMFSDIVYMGAACTIRDFSNTALVYIKENQSTHFYNLCLHPQNEREEKYAYGIAPHGSLLDWIDGYITQQRTELDGTLGKWNNIMRALPVLDFLTQDNRQRIHVRGFGRGQHLPRTHGDLNNVEFEYWKPAYWKPIHEKSHGPASSGDHGIDS